MNGVLVSYLGYAITITGACITVHDREGDIVVESMALARAHARRRRRRDREQGR